MCIKRKSFILFLNIDKSILSRLSTTKFDTVFKNYFLFYKTDTFDSDRDDQDDLDEEKMIRTELMNISTKQPDVKIYN
jgi:hypothetical protein